MSREAWRLIKHSKMFYINSYRNILRVLVVSMLLNLLLASGLAWKYFSRPPHDYYATSGITPPVMLTAMGAPNMQDTPLMQEEETSDNGERELPQ